MGAVVIAFTLSNCTNNNEDLPQETVLNQNRNSEVSFNEIISAGAEVVYEASEDYVEENSHLLEEEFKSIETMSVVSYSDFHLLKVNGLNLDGAETTHYYSMDEIEGSGSELRRAGGGGFGGYCNTCSYNNSGKGVLIYYYYMRPDGTLYLRNTECFKCPAGLDHALGM